MDLRCLEADLGQPLPICLERVNAAAASPQVQAELSYRGQADRELGRRSGTMSAGDGLPPGASAPYRILSSRRLAALSKRDPEYRRSPGRICHGEGEPRKDHRAGSRTAVHGRRRSSRLTRNRNDRGQIQSGHVAARVAGGVREAPAHPRLRRGRGQPQAVELHAPAAAVAEHRRELADHLRVERVRTSGGVRANQGATVADGDVKVIPHRNQARQPRQLRQPAVPAATAEL